MSLPDSALFDELYKKSIALYGELNSDAAPLKEVERLICDCRVNLKQIHDPFYDEIIAMAELIIKEKKAEYSGRTKKKSGFFVECPPHSDKLRPPYEDLERVLNAFSKVKVFTINRICWFQRYAEDCLSFNGTRNEKERELIERVQIAVQATRRRATRDYSLSAKDNQFLKRIEKP